MCQRFLTKNLYAAIYYIPCKLLFMILLTVIYSNIEHCLLYYYIKLV